MISVHHSSLNTHHSLLTIDDSPFIIHHSALLRPPLKNYGKSHLDNGRIERHRTGNGETVSDEKLARRGDDARTGKGAISQILEKFGRLDAVVNNAGYALAGAFEAATSEQIERQFQTNVFGVMNVCREVLPVFRQQKKGVIVNVASIGGRMTFPLYSLYNSTKWAVEGFSESLHYEVEQFGIRIKIIEPGPIKTDFYDRSQDLTRKENLTAYDHFIDRALPTIQNAGATAPDGSIVAAAIYEAVTDGTSKLRYGVNTKGVLAARRFLPDSLFFRLIKTALLK